MKPESTQLRNKQLVWDVLHGVTADNFTDHIAQCFAHDVIWQGPHPINKLNGAAKLTEQYYGPLFTSFPDLVREDDLFLAGRWREADWVCATGHYIASFKKDWLGIPASGAPMRIRFGEFYKVVEEVITECYVILDLVSVAAQAGLQLLPPSLGDDSVVPGPDTNDGVHFREQSEKESAKSAQLVQNMIDDLMRYDPVAMDYSVMRHDRCWHEDMKWYGPGGIGTTYGIDGFIEHYQRHFLTAFPDRKAGDWHIARLHEGNYVASTGWPSVVATHTGNWLGQPATNRKVGMRVMDFWRRDGDRFRENWVLIDIPDLLLQMDVDLFEQVRNGQDVCKPRS